MPMPKHRDTSAESQDVVHLMLGVLWHDEKLVEHLNESAVAVVRDNENGIERGNPCH